MGGAGAHHLQQTIVDFLAILGRLQPTVAGPQNAPQEGIPLQGGSDTATLTAMRMVLVSPMRPEVIVFMLVLVLVVVRVTVLVVVPMAVLVVMRVAVPVVLVMMQMTVMLVPLLL